MKVWWGFDESPPSINHSETKQYDHLRNQRNEVNSSAYILNKAQHDDRQE